MPKSTSLTRRRFTAIGLIIGGGAALSGSAAANKLDRRRLGALRFTEDFSDLSLYSERGKSGRWRTQYAHGQEIDGEFSRTHGDKELQCFVDPEFAGLGLDPFRLRKTQTGAELDISLSPTPPAARHACFGRPFVSGMLNSELCFSMERGYWEIAARLPRHVNGIWPAIWLMPVPHGWPPELDLVEVVNGKPGCTTHTAQHGRHEFDTTVLHGMGDLSDRVHLFGLMHDGAFITWYIDDVQVKRAPVASDQHVPFYLLITLQIANAAARGPISPRTSAVMSVAHVRAYDLVA